MKNKQLKVQPVRKYTAPKYPSYTDKNPVEYPETLPYPFRTKILHGFLLAGLVAAPQGFTLNNEPIENPFPFKSVGVPHTPSSFGTGLPDYLDGKSARKIIFKVFEEAGIELERGYVFEKERQIYLLDGYNEEKKIGFAWLDRSNFNRNNFNRWNNKVKLLSFYPIKLASEIYSIERFYKKEDWNKKDEITKALRVYAKKASTNQNEDLSLAPLVHEITTFLVSKNLFQANEALKNEAKKAFELSKEQQLPAFEKIYLKYEINTLAKAVQLGNEYSDFVLKKLPRLKTKKLQRHHRNLSDLYELSNSTYNPTQREAIQNALEQFGKTKNLKKLEQRIEEQLKIYTKDFSLEELTQLDEQAINDKIFIAPISTYDRRFQYHNYSVIPDTTNQRISNKAKEIFEEQGREKAREYTTKERMKSYEIYKDVPKQNALQELEKQVRQYILWAKSQGMY